MMTNPVQDRIDKMFPEPRSLTLLYKAQLGVVILDRARSQIIRHSRGVMTREAVEVSGQIQAFRMILQGGRI